MNILKLVHSFFDNRANTLLPKPPGLAEYFRSHPHPGGIIVCKSRKFIYMKPARTAGTSILRNYIDKECRDIVHNKDHPAAFQDWLKQLTDIELQDYFIFTVVRNPWERFLSAYFYLKIPVSFERFVGEYPIFCQSDARIWYTHAESRCFMDMICSFENLDADWKVLCRKLSLPYRPLKWVNATRHDHYSRYYPGDDQVNRVGEYYATDVRLFGYEFQRK
jgi:hypothetical protein